MKVVLLPFIHRAFSVLVVEWACANARRIDQHKARATSAWKGRRQDYRDLRFGQRRASYAVWIERENLPTFTPRTATQTAIHQNHHHSRTSSRCLHCTGN